MGRTNEEAAQGNQVDFIKVTVLGDTGVGKSALVIRFMDEKFIQDYDPTIEDSYRKRVQIDGDWQLFEIFDTAPEFTMLREHYMKTSHAYLLCYSLSRDDEDQIQLLEEHYKSFPEICENPEFITVVVGTKSDLYQGDFESKPGAYFARKHGLHHVCTSAWEGININDPFNLVGRIILGKTPRFPNCAKLKSANKTILETE